MAKSVDMSGQVFHQLTVLAKSPQRSIIGRIQWECRCDCGNVIHVPTGALNSGNTKSCGCRRVEVTRQRGLSRRTHGMTGSPEYKAWQSMKDRCYNEDCHNYPLYGARGIVVWFAWMKSFAAFLKDMGPRPSPLHSLDRIDNDGNYRPDNCRWATQEEQANNKRNNQRVEFNGTTRTVAQVARDTGVSHATLRTRLKGGLDIHQAVARVAHKGKPL